MSIAKSIEKAYNNYVKSIMPRKNGFITQEERQKAKRKNRKRKK